MIMLNMSIVHHLLPLIHMDDFSRSPVAILLPFIVIVMLIVPDLFRPIV